MSNKDSDNIILSKSYNFALRILNLGEFLNKKRSFIISNQVVRSGTSIGANVEEVIGGHSKKEFIQKMLIAYREARETRYWIRLLRDSKQITTKAAESLILDCEELIKILGKIISTSRGNLNK